MQCKLSIYGSKHTSSCIYHMDSVTATTGSNVSKLMEMYVFAMFLRYVFAKTPHTSTHGVSALNHATLDVCVGKKMRRHCNISLERFTSLYRSLDHNLDRETESKTKIENLSDSLQNLSKKYGYCYYSSLHGIQLVKTTQGTNFQKRRVRFGVTGSPWS